MADKEETLNKLIKRAEELSVEAPCFKESAIISMNLEKNLMADLVVGFGMSKDNKQYKEVETKYNLYRDFALFYGFNVFACQYHSSPPRRSDNLE